MELHEGQSLLHYRLVEKIGEGGMGVVWKAVDSSLDREVAIKILPPLFAREPERLARFEREAKLLAALNHPNVAAIHSVHSLEHDGESLRFIAMEYVAGEDLAQRLERGAIPVDESLEIARQIAAGFAAAHEKGVIHRDLKPANVKLTMDGDVKVLDFGLAKALAGDSDSDTGSSLSHSPTITSAGTIAGVILGTASYMSPEQAKGQPLDRRTDSWAFGCLLFEMLTGTRAFPGDNVAEVIGAILHKATDLTALPVTTPPRIRRLLARCLQKKKKERLRDLGDAGLVIAEASDDQVGSELAHDAQPTASAGSSRLAWTIAALAVVVALGLTAILLRPDAEQAAAARIEFSIDPPEGTLLRVMDEWAAPPAVSPDGRHVVFGLLDGEGNRLWLRSLDNGEARPLPGTENATRPFWSPDSKSVAYFAAKQLRRVDIDGGPAFTICDVSFGRGGSWSPNGTIIIAPDSASSIYKVPAAGGVPVPVTELSQAPRESSHRYPRFLPDGEHFIYLSLSERGAAGTAEESENQVMLGSLAGSEPRVLLKGVSNADSVDGHLLYRRGTGLQAQRFDMKRLEPVGESFTVADPVRYNSAFERAIFAGSGNVVAYLPGDYSGETDVLLVTRDGSVVQNLSGGVEHAGISWSPDGQRIALQSAGPSGTAIWLIDVKRGVRNRLTFGDGIQGASVWSPDGRRLAYGTLTYDNKRHVSIRDVDGDRDEILEGTAGMIPTSWTSDGRYLLMNYLIPPPGVFADGAMVLDLTQPGEPRPLHSNPQLALNPVVSPNGRWLAYTSDETGRAEVYLTRFPSGEGKWLVSVEGGLEPIWDAGGKSLYYRSVNHEVMEVPMRDGGESPELGSPSPLFRIWSSLEMGERSYDVSSDGQSFVVNTISEESLLTPMTVIVNWRP